MGFASGFRAGWDAVGEGISDREKRQLKEKLGQEGARYGVTEGAYGADLSQNIEQVRGLQMQAGQQALERGASVEEVAQIENQFTPSIAELQRRQGLTAPDYSVGSRAQNFATRQEAQQAAAPMRAEGLAGVYRQAGEIEKADELEARAFEQQRGLAQETRAQAEFKTRQEAAGLQLDKARREAEAATRMDLFDAWTAENPGVDLAAVKDAAKRFKLSSDQVLSVTARMAGLQDNELKLWKNEVQNTIKGKSDEELVNLFNTDDRFDPTTNMERKVGKDGSVTLTLKRQDGTVVSTYKAPDAATATAYLRKQALEPETLADWLLDRKKTEQAIATSAAQADAAGRSNRGEKSLAQKVADAERALGRKLTDAEKAVMVGVQGRDRAPSAADLNARAKMYMESDPDLTAEQALAMAQNDLGGGLGSRTPPPPGQVPGESPWAPRTAPAPTSAPAASATPRAAPTQGLTREQVGQAVAQQQGSVQAETRVRRAAIAEFEADPRVKQAYDAVRQLRRAGESARANNIEIQINAQRDRFINSKVGGR